MPTLTITGARAIVRVKGTVVGIFESCTFNRTYGTEAIHTLGNFSPVEIPYTSAEAVTVSCTGFRVINNGIFTLGGGSVPTVQDLLSFDPFELTVTDRQTGTVIFTLHNCVPNGDNGNFNAKATSRVTVNYIGLIADDEAGSQTEAADNAPWP